MDVALNCRGALTAVALALALALPLTGCTESAEAAAETRAHREARLLRKEVDQLRTQLKQLSATNAELQSEVQALRETSYVKSAPDGFSVRLNFGATAVIIAGLASLTWIRIARMKLQPARSDGPAAGDAAP